jgi:hypothetical protein
MNPSHRLTCLQCLEHPYLADLARKDARWQAQLRQLQASVAAAAGAATGSIRCDSSTSTNTQMEDSACSSPDSRQGSLPSALSPGSMQQQQRQGVVKQAAVPRLQLQQPGIKAFPASNLGGTSSTSQSKQGTPRTSVGHAAGGTASKQRHQQQQQVQLQPLGSSKQLAAPKVQPVIKKQPSKGHAAQPTAASQSLPARSHAGSRGMPSLHLGPTKPGQLQVEVTPRSKPPAASPVAASPAAGYCPPVTRSKAAAMVAVSQAYGQSGAATAADVAAGGDVDMGDPDGPVSSRRRKRLASGTPMGGTSLRGGGRRELEAEEMYQLGPRSPLITHSPAGITPAAGSGAAGARRQQGASNIQQQQWGGSAGHTGGYAPSKMDVDINLGVASRNSSRPQSPLTRTSATGATGPYSLNAPVWRDGSREAAGLAGSQQQQGMLQQGLMPAPGGSSRWGAGVGFTGGIASPQAASAGGRGAGKAPVWGTVEPSGGSSQMGHSSLGMAASALGTWSDDAAAAAGATMGLQPGMGSGSSISTRSSLVAALPVFTDALSGLHAGGGGTAPVSSSLASGGLYGRGSMVGPQAAAMVGAAGSGGATTGVGGRYPPAPGVQLEEARASLAGAGGGHQQQQHSPPHQLYLHQHLYTHH